MERKDRDSGHSQSSRPTVAPATTVVVEKLAANLTHYKLGCKWGRISAPLGKDTSSSPSPHHSRPSRGGWEALNSTAVPTATVGMGWS